MIPEAWEIELAVVRLVVGGHTATYIKIDTLLGSQRHRKQQVVVLRSQLIRNVQWQYLRCRQLVAFFSQRVSDSIVAGLLQRQFEIHIYRHRL